MKLYGKFSYIPVELYSEMNEIKRKVHSILNEVSYSELISNLSSLLSCVVVDPGS